MEIIIFALGLGFASGFHCLGMCGPIAIAVGLSLKNKFIHYLYNLIYQFGRIITYSFLGIILGLIGESINLIGIQKQISIFLGLFLIFLFFFPKILYRTYHNKIFNYFFLILKKKLSYIIYKQSTLSKFITGILNGFLPCGAVYISLTTALSFGNIFQSVIFMFFFGIGTIPIMFISVILGKLINFKFKNILLKFYSILLLIFGILLVMRGLELGIPYISPNNNVLKIGSEEKCCK